MMNILKGYYNDFDFTKYCVINNITPTLTAPRGNTFFSNPNVSGAIFNRTVLGQIRLEIDITIPQNVMYNLDRLNKIFITDRPQKLYFSDRPERYLSCILDGEIRFSSSNKLGKAKIVLISPHSYWQAEEGYIETSFIGDTAVIENAGTAPTKPVFDVFFKSDCGYVNIIAPKGFLALGNPLQEDSINLPSSEVALESEFKTSINGISNWTQIKNAESYIPDYIKMKSVGTASANNSGLVLNTSTLGSGEYWHGHAYMKSFNEGVADQTADNFELSSQIDMSNMGGTSNTSALLIVVMDEQNNPIMTTSIYDISAGKNELVITFKIPEETNRKRSKIIYSGKLNVLNGYVKMSKYGSRLNWEVYTDKTSYTTTSVLRVGQTVHIKPSCTHAETRHPIKAGYHDLTYTIGAIKTGQDGTKAYRLDHGGWPIYWIYERDIMEYKRTVVDRAPETVSHSIVNTTIAQMKASKVFIWQAKWSNTPAYEQFTINNLKVRRTYDITHRDLKNVFTKGDHLYINTENGEVLLNGANATGLLDMDSRFFEIDGGKTQLALEFSSWARLPEVKVLHESRWLS